MPPGARAAAAEVVRREDFGEFAWAWTGVRPTQVSALWGRARVRGVLVAYSADAIFVAFPEAEVLVRGRPALARGVLGSTTLLIPLGDAAGYGVGFDLAMRIVELGETTFPLLSLGPAVDDAFTEGAASGFPSPRTSPRRSRSS